MTDQELLEAFERRTIRPGAFHHAEHVRVAFAYLQRYDLFESLTRYRDGLRRLAAHAGAPEKYHETVTCALDWKDGVFFDYYDRSVLDSPVARRTFVLPGPR